MYVASFGNGVASRSLEGGCNTPPALENTSYPAIRHSSRITAQSDQLKGFGSLARYAPYDIEAKHIWTLVNKQIRSKTKSSVKLARKLHARLTVLCAPRGMSKKSKHT